MQVLTDHLGEEGLCIVCAAPQAADHFPWCPVPAVYTAARRRELAWADAEFRRLGPTAFRAALDERAREVRALTYAPKEGTQ